LENTQKINTDPATEADIPQTFGSPKKKRTVKDLTQDACNLIIELDQKDICKSEISRRTGFSYEIIQRILNGYKPYLNQKSHIIPFEKEKQLLLLALGGKTDMEIADELKISITAVRRHRKKYKTPSSRGNPSKATAPKPPRSLASRYGSVIQNLRFKGIPIEWFTQFRDYDKLRYLNRLIFNCNKINNRGWYDESSEWYCSYIERFYSDPNFNMLYNNWREKKIPLLRPILNHIVPLVKGGTNDLSNITIVTAAEKCCRRGLSQDKWDQIKEHIKAHADEYFL
jgi:hypothetical protein